MTPKMVFLGGALGFKKSTAGAGAAATALPTGRLSLGGGRAGRTGARGTQVPVGRSRAGTRAEPFAVAEGHACNVFPVDDWKPKLQRAPTSKVLG